MPKRKSDGTPITPAEVEKKRLENIPKFVIQAFNNLILKNYNGYEATIKQKDVVAEIKRLKPGTRNEEIFDNYWLDIDPLFIEQGWSVQFDKPAYNEEYDAFFKFSKKRGD